MARSRARHMAAKRPSMALTAFASFSALVAVSVALSNGSAPAPWESAYANESSDSQQERGTFGQPQAADQSESRPSLFAAVPNEALIANIQDTPQEYVASQVRNVSDRGTGSAPSSVAPAKRAPATFEGELPVNTIIAPAQPATVLDGGKFGWRTAPDTGDREFHNGTDISTTEGTPVVAALDGTVTAVFWDEWGGNRVEVSHADGMKTTYNHLKDVMVQVGDPLKASEQLGTIGQTGLRVTGPHLHFETWVEGKAVDAQSFDWETGEGIIPASRPKYSLEDQAQTDQSVTDNGSVPGTDNGPMSEVPEDEQDRIIALSHETSPAQDVPEESADSESGSGGSESGPVSESREDNAPTTESRPAQSTPSRNTSGSQGGTEGRVNAGSPSRGTSDATPSRPSNGSTQGGGSGASSNTSKADSAAQDKAAAEKAAKDAAAKKAAAEKAADEKAAAEKAAAEKAARDKAAAEKKAAEEAKKRAEAEANAPKPPVDSAPDNPAAPADGETPTKPKPPVEPVPEKPAKPAEGETETKPGTPAEPEVPGTPTKPDTQPEAPKPETPVKGDKPAVNPYIAPVSQLTTLEQLQQRTQSLVNHQLALTPEQQFGPASQLNAQLPLLTQQLITANVAQQNPAFTAQLTATQAAVEKAAATPKDKKLTDAATAELTKLQAMLATVPAYVDPAAAPAG